MHAIVWRKSVYENNYVCKCGKKLFDGRKIVDDMLFSTEKEEMICPVCGWNVAKVQDIKEVEKGAIRIEKA